MRSNLASVQEPGETPAPSDLSDLYRRVWSNVTYRNFAPGEHNIEPMLNVLMPRRGTSFIDFGCGTGRPANELAKRGFSVLAIDFADNCLDEGIDVPFLVSDLCELPKLNAEFGFCTDVMEHIPTERVDEVLAGISRCVRNAAFFSISKVADNFGPVLVTKQLHLTMKDGAWWKYKLSAHFPIVEIVDENKIQVLVVARHIPRGFLEHRPGLVNTVCNTPLDGILANIKINARREDVKWLRACEEHDRHAVLVGGGPSLKHCLAEIKARQNDPNTKQDIFALNGAAKFLLSQGIVPDYLVVVDPREQNIEFVKDFPARAYLLAAQCHPRLFDALEGKDVTTFLMHLDEIAAKKDELLPKGTLATPVIGPITCGLTSMSVAACAGYRKIHLYGYDSSDAEGEAHAYAQGLSTAEAKRLNVFREGKTYSCSFAMFEQASTFPQFARMLADFGAIITVHGTGLLPDIAREMAANQGD